MPTRLHLYWLEPTGRWESRGYAKNRHLWIDFTEKSYILQTNYMCGDYSYPEHIEVKRKTDIDAYCEYLDKMGFSNKCVS